MKGIKTQWIVIAIVVVIALWLVGAYNNFVGLQENVNTAWAQVENQYQRRVDLIPNLVKTVQGIATQEQEVFLGVAEARSKVGGFNFSSDDLGDSAKFAQFQELQGGLSSAIARLLVTVENYPVLKSNENFLALQSQLEGTENRISVERKRFNEDVRAYNVRAKGIPGKWLASVFGFDAEKALFAADEGADEVPEVDFSGVSN